MSRLIIIILVNLSIWGGGVLYAGEGNSPQKTYRKYFLQSQPLEEKALPTARSRLNFSKKAAQLRRMGGAVYQQGHRYQILVPHSAIFQEKSTNMLRKAVGNIEVIHSFISFFPIEKIKYTAMAVTKKPSAKEEVWLDGKKLAAQQTAALVNELNTL